VNITRLILPDILRVDVCRTRSLAKPGLRICVTGGRDYKEEERTYERLNLIHFTTPIIELGVGCARGLDAFALQWAIDNQISYRRYIADWDAIGTEAGCLRNGVMLVDFKPDRLLVFPGGTGTTDCARKARKLRIEREFFEDETDPFINATRWG
jgi:hypothetical protein